MEKIDVKQFIPESINSGKKNNQYLLRVQDNDDQYYVWYERPISNKKGIVGKRRHEAFIPKTILFDAETFEILGLLQGEMSKTHRQILTFANSEPTILDRVLAWFERENLAKREEWNWYIKVNLSEAFLTNEIKERVTQYWTQQCNLTRAKAYTKTVVGTEASNRTSVTNNGTVMIERSGPIFIQLVQELVRQMTLSMPGRKEEEIMPYMRGIIAAEGCVNYDPIHGHRRVFITAVNDHERMIFEACLNRLGIETYDCSRIKDIVISRRDNILRIKDMGLIDGNEDKHARFQEMISTYTGTWHEKRKKPEDLI